MDAYLTAVSADFKKDDDEANPYVVRALSALANAGDSEAINSVAALGRVTQAGYGSVEVRHPLVRHWSPASYPIYWEGRHSIPRSWLKYISK